MHMLVFHEMWKYMSAISGTLNNIAFMHFLCVEKNISFYDLRLKYNELYFFTLISNRHWIIFS